MNFVTILSWVATAPFVAIMLLKVTALLSLGAVIAFVWRNGAPAVQHHAWTAGLCGAFFLPIVTTVVPAWRVGMLPALAWETPLTSSEHVPAPVRSGSRSADHDQTLRSQKSHGDPAHQGGRPARSNSEAPAWNSSPTTHDRSSWPFSLWALGACIFLARITVGQYGLRRLRHRASPITTGAWHADLQEECARAGVRRPVHLCSSAALTTPLTWGTRVAVIALPERMIDCAAEYRAMVLRHELAHVVRRDALTHLMATFTCALYWFHPLVWFAARRQRSTCEHACDARVLSYGTPAVEYATQLLELARSARDVGPHRYAALAMARPLHLERRLLTILNAPIRHTRVSRGARVAGVSISFATLFVTAAFRPVPRPPTKPFPQVSRLQKQTSRPATAPAGTQALDVAPRTPREVPSAPRRAGAARAPVRASGSTVSTPATHENGTLVLDVEPDDTVDITGTDERRISVYGPTDARTKNVRLVQTYSGARLVSRRADAPDVRNSARLFRVRMPRRFTVSSANPNMNVVLHNVEGVVLGAGIVPRFPSPSEVRITRKLLTSTGHALAGRSPIDLETFRKLHLLPTIADTDASTISQKIDSLIAALTNSPEKIRAHD